MYCIVLMYYGSLDLEDAFRDKSQRQYIMPMEMINKRLAVLVGCNYPNTPNELHGCINDVLSMRDTLVTHFGFDQLGGHIQLLIDDVAPAAAGSLMPTGANIKKALDCMVDQALPGDILFFHYSGHGTRIPSLKPINHPFRRQDEAIVPCDFNLITDVDMRKLVNRVPKGASFTIISDSCHSGGLIDKEKEQIGPNSSFTPNYTMPYPKTIPFESVLQHLASLTGPGIITSNNGIGTHFLEVFGADASLRFRLQAADHQPFFHHPVPDEGILLSGCQANETSADMNPFHQPGGGGGMAYGAFSNAVQTVLKDEHFGKISNKQLVMLARKVLHAQGIQQHPCLYCNDQNADATFLCQS